MSRAEDPNHLESTRLLREAKPQTPLQASEHSVQYRIITREQLIDRKDYLPYDQQFELKKLVRLA